MNPGATPARPPLARARLAYTLPELAEAVPCSVKLLRAEIARGRLRATRVGRLIRVRVGDAEAWLRDGVIGGGA